MCDACGIDRRRLSRRTVVGGGLVAGIGAGGGAGGGAALAALFGARAAEAAGRTLLETLCAFGGRSRLGRLSPPSRGAGAEGTQIQRVIGHRATLYVFRGDVGNALAAVARDGRGARRRIIAYSPSFMNALARRGGRAAPRGGLGHEGGPPAYGARVGGRPRRGRWCRELGADYVSGVALARLGYTPDEASRGLRLLYSRFGSRTHPDTPRRLEAMAAGWRDGGRRERLALG